jgi:hypothetical protein
MAGYEICTKVCFRSLKVSGHSEDLGVDGRITLKWILTKYGEKVRTGLIWLRRGMGAGSCEHSNKPLGSIKGGEFLD